MDEDGFKVDIEAGVLRLYDLQRQLLAKVHRSPSRLYFLDMDIAAPVCLTARVGDMAWRWHERYGHLNFQALRKLGRADKSARIVSWQNKNARHSRRPPSTGLRRSSN
jgi:hypothetical protein